MSTAIHSSSASLNASSGSTASSAAKAGSGKLAAAAKEFESVLLGQWLQGAETSFGSVPGADEDTDAGGSQMQSFGVQQLAGALVAHGGIGIAQMVQTALQHAQMHPSSTSGTAGTGSPAPVSNLHASSMAAMAAYQGSVNHD